MMGKEVKECVEFVIYERYMRWLVFSEDECDYSCKEARRKE